MVGYRSGFGVTECYGATTIDVTLELVDRVANAERTTYADRDATLGVPSWRAVVVPFARCRGRCGNMLQRDRHDHAERSLRESRRRDDAPSRQGCSEGAGH